MKDRKSIKGEFLGNQNDQVACDYPIRPQKRFKCKKGKRKKKGEKKSNKKRVRKRKKKGEKRTRKKKQKKKGEKEKGKINNKDRT